MLLLTVSATACDQAQETGLGPGPEPARTEISWSDSVATVRHQPFPAPSGRWEWTWRDSSDLATDPSATLTTSTSELWFHWTWTFPEPLAPWPEKGMPGFLTPADTVTWHSMTLDQYPVPSRPLFPMPRLEVDSPHFPHLLALLQELTTPWFDQRVAHWPDSPIPVRVGTAISGLVDLSACLREAIEIWNGNAPEPWFRIDEEAPWGVRLIHFQNTRLSPPLEIRITRLDSEGSPLRMNLVAGNNYDDLREPKYVVRGFVHELGHALFLWGHSPDRDHSLWGIGPPIVEQPSQDERKAARLLHGLPEGLDLSRYY